MAKELTDDKKAELLITISSEPSQSYVDLMMNQSLALASREYIEEQLLELYPQYGEIIKNMDDETLMTYVRASIESRLRSEYAEQVRTTMSAMPESALAYQFDNMEFSDEQYIKIYGLLTESDVSDSTYEKNLELLGYVSLDAPSQISIYVNTFSNKDKIADIIKEYNASATDENKISYTDYVGLLMSSITTIINVISYVLIAFVAVSLVVSSIMIGIITYISVLERTKEIGILRSIGASKRDISRVFNAETLTIGFFSGIIGIGTTLLLTLPINAVIRFLSGISNIGAVLPPIGGAILVAVSMLLTFIAGLIPSRVAANKDPVAALRTE